jgi:hypothetical protein
MPQLYQNLYLGYALSYIYIYTHTHTHKLRSLNIFSRFYYYTVKAFLISCNVCADVGGTVISLSQHVVTNKIWLNIFQFFVYRADPSCWRICAMQFWLFTELLLWQPLCIVVSDTCLFAVMLNIPQNVTYAILSHSVGNFSRSCTVLCNIQNF